MPSQNMPAQRQKGAVLPTDFPLCGLNPFGGNFPFSGPCIVKYFRNKDQQDAVFLIYSNESVLYIF
jgi:hypothetical protein